MWDLFTFCAIMSVQGWSTTVYTNLHLRFPPTVVMTLTPFCRDFTPLRACRKKMKILKRCFLLKHIFHRITLRQITNNLTYIVNNTCSKYNSSPLARGGVLRGE